MQLRRAVINSLAMKRLTRLLVLAAFIFSCGGHWCLLQGIAWIGMIHEYAQDVPLTEAITMTLGGRYPCALCQAIAEKKEAERIQLGAMEKYEKKFFPPLSIEVPAPIAASFPYPDLSVSFPARSESPPTPPPRLS